MQTLTVKITGTSDLIMHSDRLCNPLDPAKKEIATYTGKRKKTDADHEEIARLEWRAGMYYDDELGPHLPGRMIKAMLIGAAKKTKESPKVKSGLVVMSDKARLEYDGPRDPAKMWKSGAFTDIRSVVIQRARLMRCRPIFRNWSVTVEIIYDESVIDKADILRMFTTGGLMIGIGDYRPENSGDFGRFSVAEVK